MNMEVKNKAPYCLRRTGVARLQEPIIMASLFLDTEHLGEEPPVECDEMLWLPNIIRHFSKFN
jgi:hypothetical protein